MALCCDFLICFIQQLYIYNFRSPMNEIKHLISQKSDPEDTYELLDILGQGSYGSVSKALHKATGQLYAIKILPATSGVQISAIKKQIGILKQCDDVHIVKYFGSYFKDNNLWIVMEYCIAGSMADIMQITKKRFNENEIASILQSVLKGLDYLHSHKKIHRDIKAANILLDKEGNAKLADFGVSASALQTNARFRTHIGSPYWMSPEIIKYSEYTYKTDIWSLGITAIQLAEGQVPNSEVKPYRIPLIIKKKPVQSFKDPNLWSQQFNDFIKQCLQINPSDRPEARQLLDHPFIKKYSKGQRLLSQLVLSSIQQIQEFRVNQSRDNSFAQIIIDEARQYIDETKTLVERQSIQKRQHEELDEDENHDQQHHVGDDEIEGGGSMIIINSSRSNSCTGTVVADSSMIQHDQDDIAKPVDPLTSYINGLKKQSNVQQRCMQRLVQALNNYDQQLTLQLQKVFDAYKEKVKASIQSVEELQKNNPHLKENSQYKCRLKEASSLEQFLNIESKIRQKKTSSTLLVNSRLKADQQTTPHSKIEVKHNQSTQVRAKDENKKKGEEVRQQVKSFLIPNNDTYPSDMWKSKKSYIQTQNNHLLDQNNSSNETEKIQKPLSNAHNSSRIMIKRTDPYNQIASSQVVREFANDPQVLEYLRQKNYLNNNSSSVNYTKSTFHPVYTCSSINSRQFLHQQRSTEKSKSKSKNKTAKNMNKCKKIKTKL